MDIELVMKMLYDSEINFSISCFWDNGFDVCLGDEFNGYKAGGNFRTLDECAEFMDTQARIRYPESSYALGLGKLEHGRREAVRMAEAAGR